MTDLVTGAAGFAGSHLVDMLRAKRLNVEVFRGDLRSLEDCRKQTKDIDIIYHLAAVSMIDETREKPFETWESNTTGTLNLLTAARENGVNKVVYASTCHIYGKQPDSAYPFTEKTQPNPLDIYSASKYAAEHICQAFVNTHGMNVSIARAFNHFGPRQRVDWVIPTMIRGMLTNEEIHLRNPNLTRDFSYVDDIVNGYEAIAMFGKPGEIYQLCSGVERSLKSVAELVRNLISSEGTIDFDVPSRDADLDRSVGSLEKAQKELYWTPAISFEDGLKRTITWMEQHI